MKPQTAQALLLLRANPEGVTQLEAGSRGVTFAEIAAELLRIATETRDVAALVDSDDPTRWAIARDLRAVAFSIERASVVASKVAAQTHERQPVSA